MKPILPLLLLALPALAQMDTIPPPKPATPTTPTPTTVSPTGLGAPASDKLPIWRQYPHWTISAFASLGATMADGATTAYALDYRHLPGIVETNPLIVKINSGNNAVFGPGGFAYKGIAWGGQTAIQYWLLRRAENNGGNVASARLAKRFAIVNWIVAAGFDCIAIHNARVVKILH